jgi:hypothetical protein
MNRAAAPPRPDSASAGSQASIAAGPSAAAGVPSAGIRWTGHHRPQAANQTASTPSARCNAVARVAEAADSSAAMASSAAEKTTAIAIVSRSMGAG